jgi:hypothetical protein
MSDSQSSTAGPVTWPEVVAEFAPLYSAGLDMFDELPHELASSKPPQYAGGRLGGFDITVAALAALCGGAAALKALEPIASGLARAVEEIEESTGPIDRNRVRPPLYTLNVLNVARCVGAPIPRVPADLEERWLPQLAKLMSSMNEREQHTLALASDAASLVALTPIFANTRAPTARFSAGEVHGFNVPAFSVHLAAAIEQGASYQDVEPAWLDFVHRFPYKLDTGMLGWPALLWAARAVYATLGKLAEAEVADELHRLVTGA